MSRHNDPHNVGPWIALVLAIAFVGYLIYTGRFA